MKEPYLGEIRMFAGNYAPENWMNCDGSLLSIQDNGSLWGLIGTTYGGDGQSTFALPDLRSRVAVGVGSLPGGGQYQLGQTGGAENVTLAGQQVPVHTHGLMATTGGQQASPAGAVPASVDSSYNLYGSVVTNPGNTGVSLNKGSVGSAGGGGPHANVQPYLGMRYIICVSGQYPTKPSGST